MVINALKNYGHTFGLNVWQPQPVWCPWLLVPWLLRCKVPVDLVDAMQPPEKGCPADAMGFPWPTVKILLPSVIA